MPEPLDDSAATSRGPWEGDRETEQERLNRELDQLVSELRVALPGIQVLLAFLLTVPFTTRFHDLSTSARDVYFAAVTLVATSSVLLIAPTVHHRVRFRDGTKEEMIYAANRLALAGTACLALGLGAAMYVAGEAALPRWGGPVDRTVRDAARRRSVVRAAAPLPRPPAPSPGAASRPDTGGDALTGGRRYHPNPVAPARRRHPEEPPR